MLVCIKRFHIRKVSIANANNDDGHGQVRRFDNGLLCVRHVRQNAVGEKQQNEIILIEHENCQTTTRFLFVVDFG